MARILDGKATATEIRAEVRDAVTQFAADHGRAPGLAVILAGDDPASKIYVGSKIRACQEAGLISKSYEFDSSVTREEILARIDAVNSDPEIDGLLVQLPIPDHLDEREVLLRVDPAKDVDGFHPWNVGSLWRDEPGFAPATPSGVIELLKRSGIEMSGKNAVVVGRSTIVGKPMAALLLRENATVTICHSRTQDLAATCRRADILVVAIGRPGMVGAEGVKEGAAVIDVGINRLTERADVERFFPGDEARMEIFERRGSTLIGDVDFTRAVEALGESGAITPVPGGVGPLTVAMLLVNTLEAARRREASGAAASD